MASTVRVDTELHDTLREIAEAEHRPIGKVIEDAIREYKVRKFWREMREDFERLRADPVAWKEYQDEAKLFEGGSMDGLEHEEPYYTAAEEAEIEAHAKSQGW